MRRTFFYIALSLAGVLLGLVIGWAICQERVLPLEAKTVTEMSTITHEVTKPVTHEITVTRTLRPPTETVTVQKTVDNDNSGGIPADNLPDTGGQK